MSHDEATALVGTTVDDELAPTFRSPTEGGHVRLVDEATGDTVGLVTALSAELRARLRAALRSIRYGENIARRKSTMAIRGVTFGYAPRNPLATQEGCRMTALGRDRPDVEELFERIATETAVLYRELIPEIAVSDDELLSSKVADEWRIGEESYWTSGVVNATNLLPYHRDGNNFATWSAMPSIRYGVAGGHLHLPEYGVVFPVGDGDVTSFYGRGLVHGVTPMRRRRPDGYRFTVVYYALRGLANCASYAEETRLVAYRRTERERAEAERVRADPNRRVAYDGSSMFERSEARRG